jgi:2,5-dihydroxypyridine 5,6-dioxygenase
LTVTYSAIDLVPMFKRELEMCRLEPGETVGIYTEGGVRREYAQAFAAAAEELGAHAFHVDLPGLGRSFAELGGRASGRGLAARPALVEAFKRCDLLIDLVMLLFEPEKAAIQEAGTRVLSCVEPPDALVRMFPTEEQRRRARTGEALLARASSLRVVSDAGTDITYQLGQYTPFCQYGIADEPGRWDHFASSIVVTVANDGGVNGEVVLDTGDIVSPYPHYVRDPVRLTVRDGYVERIDGADGVAIQDAMSRHDRRAFAVSHIGWGLNEGARWDALALDPSMIGLDPRSYEGSVMFSTGPNTEFGGTNDTPCHFDMPMRNCSLYVDDELIVDRGRMVEGSSALESKVMA